MENLFQTWVRSLPLHWFAFCWKFKAGQSFWELAKQSVRWTICWFGLKQVTPETAFGNDLTGEEKIMRYKVWNTFNIFNLAIKRPAGSNTTSVLKLKRKRQLWHLKSLKFKKFNWPKLQIKWSGWCSHQICTSCHPLSAPCWQLRWKNGELLCFISLLSDYL